jgi:hypothetical protein
MHVKRNSMGIDSNPLAYLSFRWELLDGENGDHLGLKKPATLQNHVLEHDPIPREYRGSMPSKKLLMQNDCKTKDIGEVKGMKRIAVDPAHVIQG